MPGVVNMSNMGYPSIINNNIQGLSINYSNHIIAPHPLQTQINNSKSTEVFTDNLAKAEYLPSMTAMQGAAEQLTPKQKEPHNDGR